MQALAFASRSLSRSVALIAGQRNFLMLDHFSSSFQYSTNNWSPKLAGSLAGFYIPTRFLATEAHPKQPNLIKNHVTSAANSQTPTKPQPQLQPQQQQQSSTTQQLSPLSPQKRKSRKLVDFGRPRYPCNGYATADQYDNMADVLVDLAADHNICSLPDDVGNDAIFCSLRSPSSESPALRKDFVVFWDGCVVFWNCTKEEQASVLRTLKPFERNPHPPQLVESEVENVDFIVADGGPARVIKDTIIVSSLCSPLSVDDSDSDIEPAVLAKFAFSEAVRLSVRLAIWENQLIKLGESVDGVIDDLRKGRRLRTSRSDVLRHCGNLLLFRHRVNMASDLTQTPDFYWDRPQLEDLFRRTRSFLNVPHRTRLMNDKLNHSFELVELVRSHLNDSHHIRLEWMIIALICIEVVFDALPCLGRFFMP